MFNINEINIGFLLFCNSYLAAPLPTLGKYRGDSLTHPALITAYLQFWPEGHLEPCDEIGP